MEEWRRVDGDHYRAKFDSGTFDARRADGEWTLWFQANMTRGFIRKPGAWKHLAKAKHQATVLDNDHFLNRS